MLYTVGLDGLEFKDILEILKKYSIDSIEDIRGLDKGKKDFLLSVASSTSIPMDI